MFARTGDDFVRVTTSLKKQDGARAIGTLLDRKSPAYAPMLGGQRFIGMATLFGKQYITEICDGLIAALQRKGLARTEYAHTHLRDTLREF